MDSHQFEEKLFAEALALPESERARFLERECGGNESLVGRVNALLVEHGHSHFLDDPHDHTLAEAARAAVESTAPLEGIGTVVGRYRLLEKIGEGGCGVVFRAEQTDPVRRFVAFKVIKLGMDTKAVVARFEAERQALALMNHPGIARVFDGGATAGGRPYFVMELVDGVKITEFCDRHRLGISNRLRLFARICEAVQHAHQKGIIHRDLKPSNILVASEDGQPAPKIIDFGIAKATQGRLADYTLVTAVGHFIGTPAYMCPEQARLGEPDIDTRADIYSLGVLLYELLTGATPLDSPDLRSSDIDEVRRRICEVDPPFPSARVRGLGGDVLSLIAARRRIEAHQLQPLLRGDLDWIVMRCLEKERTRRYDTAAALVREIERHLNHEPVLARPPRASYLLAKFIRRHRVGVAAGTAVAVALLAGIATSTTLYWQAIAAEHQQRLLRERAENGERNAQTEAARSAEVARFMQEMLSGVSIPVARGRDTRLLRDLLDATARRLDQEPPEFPEVEADLRGLLGSAYATLAEFPQALAMQRRALGLCEQFYGKDHPNTLDVLENLACTIRDQGERAKALELFGVVLERRQRLPAAENLALARTYELVGRELIFQGQYAQADHALRESLRIRERLLPTDDPQILETMKQLAYILQNQRKLPEAEAAYRDLLSRYRAATMEYSGVTRSVLVQDLGRLLTMRGKWDEAEQLLRESIHLQQQQSPSDGSHPRALDRIVVTKSYLVTVLVRRSRWSEASDLNGEVLAHFREQRRLQPENFRMTHEVAKALNMQAELLRNQNRHAESESMAREAADMLRGLPTSKANRFPEAMMRMGMAQAAQGRWSDAEASFREGLDDEVKGEPSTRGYALAFGLLDALARQGKADEAQAAASSLVEIARTSLQRHGLEKSGLFTIELVESLVAHRRGDLATPVAREFLTLWEAHHPEAWQTAAFRALVGCSLLREGRHAEAEPYLTEGHAGLQKRAAHVPASTGGIQLFVRRSLEQLLAETGRSLATAETP